MMQTSGLSFQYEKGEEISFPDISIESGQHTLIIGASGSGKTTLLHLLAGLRKPRSGKIELMGQSLSDMPQDKMDRFRGQHIGMIFQVPHFIRSLSVMDNLSLAQSLAGYKPDEQLAEELLGRLNLGNKASKFTNELSVGEQQRVAIIRAIINKPDIILADEPTSALDDINAEKVIELLRTQADSIGATLVVVTHDQRLKDKFSETVRL